VGLVISSDLRRLFDAAALVRLLEPTLGHRFFCVVDCIESSRANEIIADAAERGLTKWIALDDQDTVLIANWKRASAKLLSRNSYKNSLRKTTNVD
jgi:hypothetical protein